MVSFKDGGEDDVDDGFEKRDETTGEVVVVCIKRHIDYKGNCCCLFLVVFSVAGDEICVCNDSSTWDTRRTRNW
jgi:hypothetical protein